MNSNPKIHYYRDGKIKYEEYFLNNKRHRVDGPAEIYYFGNGKIRSEHYYLNDKRHKTDGPAIISYYENGQISSEHYWIEGGKYHKQEYTKLINDIKQLPEGVRLTDNRRWVREYE